MKIIANDKDQPMYLAELLNGEIDNNIDSLNHYWDPDLYTITANLYGLYSSNPLLNGLSTSPEEMERWLTALDKLYSDHPTDSASHTDDGIEHPENFMFDFEEGGK